LIRCPVGIAEDISVRIGNSFVPVDFMVIDMDVCHQIPSFLSTTGVAIDVAARIIKLNISGKEETFTFKPKGMEQCNQVKVTIRLEWNVMTPDMNPALPRIFL
jgi:hypothetical protein